MNAVGVRIGQIIVRDVSEARLRTAFPSDPRPRCTEFFDLVSDTNTHAARTRTGTHEASQDRLL
jgi:hypothetical protein